MAKKTIRITIGKRVFGKVGTLSGKTLYRSINTLYVFDGKGKNRKLLAIAKFI